MQIEFFLGKNTTQSVNAFSHNYQVTEWFLLCCKHREGSHNDIALTWQEKKPELGPHLGGAPCCKHVTYCQIP